MNFNIVETERRFRSEMEKWPDGCYEADVWIDHDTVGHEDVHVHVACRVAGDQLTVDMTGSDDRPELVNVWNTFSNSRGYAMAQLVSMVDPTIVKNEGLFNAVEMIIPEGTIVQPPPNKPAALGAFHPACEIGEAICIALSEIVPHRALRRRSTSSACPTPSSASMTTDRCGWIREWTCGPPTHRPPKESMVGDRCAAVSAI